MNAVSRVILTTVLALAGLDALARVPDKCIVLLEARPTRNDTVRAPCPLLIRYPATTAPERAARRARDAVAATAFDDSRAMSTGSTAPLPAAHA